MKLLGIQSITYIVNLFYTTSPTCLPTTHLKQKKDLSKPMKIFFLLDKHVVENIIEKGEIVGLHFEQFPRLSQCFQKPSPAYDSRCVCTKQTVNRRYVKIYIFIDRYSRN